MKSGRLDVVDLLKIDVEGSEFSLLSGDLSSPTKVRRIVMEVHRPHGDVIALARTLEAAGFSVTATGFSVTATNQDGRRDGRRVESPGDLLGEAQEGYFFASK